MHLLDRKFCNFIYSQSHSGEGALLRKKFCRLLAKYKTVDCPGAALNNMTDAISAREGDFEQGKLDFIRDYKFTIAFENCAQIGYVTEKLVHPFVAHSLPIYWGDPEVGREYNTKAFVHVRDFESLEAVVERIKYLDTHDEEYLNILRENPYQEMANPVKALEEFLCSIIERGNHPFNKNPRMMWDTSLNLLCTNTMELAARCLDAGQISIAKEHANTCLALDSIHRSRIYPLLEDIYK